MGGGGIYRALFHGMVMESLRTPKPHSCMNHNSGFNRAIYDRWLSAQPPDVQDLLSTYARGTQIGRRIVLVFDTIESARAAQLLSPRMVKAQGVPSLEIDFRYSRPKTIFR
jgi:hypothetical protein